MEKKDTRTVTVELMQTIINYLQEKPFHEVHILINEILKQTQNKE